MRVSQREAGTLEMGTAVGTGHAGQPGCCSLSEPEPRVGMPDGRAREEEETAGFQKKPMSRGQPGRDSEGERVQGHERPPK